MLKRRVTLHNDDKLVVATCQNTGEVIVGRVSSILQHVSYSLDFYNTDTVKWTFELQERLDT